LALFLTGLQRGDIELIRDGLHDVLVEPRRAPLIPGFAQVKAAALDHCALGASISGGGPSVFAWFASKAEAEGAAPAMRAAFANAGIDSRSYVTPVAGPRAEVIEGGSA
jgi:homoserine kinase